MAHLPKEYDFSIESLGESKIPSPIYLSHTLGDFIPNYVSDNEYISHELSARLGETVGPFTHKNLMERAGPRQKIFFNPHHVHAGIVTCGGLCPGLNDVIRAIVRCLWGRYGVKRISGIRFGYKGLLPDYNFDILPLTPEVIDNCHKTGGSLLGTSRGGGNRVVDIVDGIERLNLHILFIIGGDGSQKGAKEIADEIKHRNLKISIIGIPKTVDNDISFVQKSFGFDTAIVKATEAVAAAHMEARSQINGIGLVKLMGRESGFIATYTAIASHETNFVLIPEVSFDLDGPNGLLAHLEKRIALRKHAVLVVAEGAGQDLMVNADGVPSGDSQGGSLRVSSGTDASGNKRLADIGLFLKEKIGVYFKEKRIHINLKYIDPSYLIRSAVAAPIDSIYCERLGNNAVHAAMCGKTKMIIDRKSVV